MIKYLISVEEMEQILNNSLRMIHDIGGGVGDRVRLTETVDGEVTGRLFYAQISHVTSAGISQIVLQPFMEAINDETGKHERIPMSGEFSNEKYVTPEGEWKDWQLPVKGERPIWIYKGIKWVQEISLAKLLFGGPSSSELAMNKLAPPHTLHVRLQGQGGERLFKYVIADEVK